MATATTTGRVALAMQGISKSFSGVKVLHEVDLTLYQGEVLALLGENGAGKSTLMKILNGDYRKDGGRIELFGQEVDFRTPRQAMDAGVRVIYQELNSVPELSVAENIFLGDAPVRSLAGPVVSVDWSTMNARARQVLDMLGADVDPSTPMKRLTVAEKQLVEIAKALHARASVLVMDEPTAALGQREVDRLFEVIARLKRQDVSIIYISHRLEEVFRVADRVAVLRDGRNAGEFLVGETSLPELVRAMVGRELSEVYPRKQSQIGDVVLQVRHLTSHGALEDISFDLRRGEILGVFGLLGAGRTELTRALFGAYPVHGGTIAVDGAPVRITSPRDAKRAGIALVPLDRKLEGLVLDMSVRENIVLPTIQKFARFGFLNGREQDEAAQKWVRHLGIRLAHLGQRVRFLSGGNQQKVVLAKWLEGGPKVLVLNEPTRGVDVGARVDIYNILEQLAQQGMGIIISSSDMPELLSLSDRVLVLHRGRVTAELPREEATKEKLLYFAVGGTA